MRPKYVVIGSTAIRPHSGAHGEMPDANTAVTLFGRWASILGEHEKRLGLAEEAAEREFLSIGSRLEEFYRRAVGISGMASSAAGLLSGERIKAAIGGLRDMLQKLNAEMAGSEEEITRVVGDFDRMLGAIADVREHLDDFGGISRDLRKTGVTMKIYSAQLGLNDAGFGSLAGQVKGLSEAMDARAAGIKAELDSLKAEVGRAVSAARSFDESRRRQVRAILGRISVSVASLTGKYEAAASAAGDIEASSREVSGTIARVVGSVQSHDITNQQVQRSRRAISALRSMLLPGAPSGPGDVPMMEDGHILLRRMNITGFVCRAHAGSLKSAGVRLADAAGDITDDLGDIVRSITAMSERAMRMSIGSGDSSLDEIKGNLAEVLETLSGVADNNTEVTRAAGSMARMSEKMSSFARDIGGIGDDIELIALNAAVKAANIGKEGSALGVVAGSIQKILSRAHILTGAASEFEISLNVRREADKAEDFTGRDLDSLIRAISGVVESLSEVVGKIDREGRSLSEGIQGAAKGMSGHEEFSSVIAGAASALEGILEDCKEFFPAGHFNEKNLERELAGTGMREEGRDERLLSWAFEPEPMASVQGGAVEFF